MELFVAFAILSALAVLSDLILPEGETAAAGAILGAAQAASLAAGAAVGLAGGTWHRDLWVLPGWGHLSLGETPLGAYFLLAAAAVFFAVWVYTPGYVSRYAGTYRVRTLLLLLHLTLASVAAVLLAQDAVSFLVAWEIMSVLGVLLVAYADLEPSHVQAAYVMLAMSEAGFLATVGAWLPLVGLTHRIGFAAIHRWAPAVLSPGLRWAVLLLSVFGFGVKAGLVPGMSWLPRAHPAAPANASAVLSGVILNLGIYGIVLVNVSLVPVTMPAGGLVVLGVGALSAWIGILYAATDNHLKRMLAHSSIENMGLVTTALGAGITFSALHLPVPAALGFLAALYHLLNHSLYKALLFLGAGAVDLSTGTLDMDRLGGLARRLPWTSVFVLAGSMAISALPPFNGFASEWLIIQSLLRSVDAANPTVEAAFALAGVIVALTFGLAVSAFVRLYGMTFLGAARSPAAQDAQEVPASARWGMGILAAACLALGVAPTYVADGLLRLLGGAGVSSAASALVPPFFAPAPAGLPRSFVDTFRALGAQLGQGLLPPPGLVFLHQSAAPAPHVVFAAAPGYLAGAVGLGLLAVYLGARALAPSRGRRLEPPWWGGARDRDPALTYTATGLSNPVRVVFRAILSPQRPVDREEVVAEHFRTAIFRQVPETYVMDRWVFFPLARAGRRLAHLLARMHHGSVNAYIGYAFLSLLAALLVVHFS